MKKLVALSLLSFLYLHALPKPDESNDCMAQECNKALAQAGEFSGKSKVKAKLFLSPDQTTLCLYEEKTPTITIANRLQQDTVWVMQEDKAISFTINEITKLCIPQENIAGKSIEDSIASNNVPKALLSFDIARFGIIFTIKHDANSLLAKFCTRITPPPYQEKIPLKH